MGLNEEEQVFEGRRLVLETEEDRQRKIECGHCGVQTSITEFARGEPLTGYAGDVVAAPIDVLRCPSCRELLGELDEGTSTVKPYVILERGARCFI